MNLLDMEAFKYEQKICLLQNPNEIIILAKFFFLKKLIRLDTIFESEFYLI